MAGRVDRHPAEQQFNGAPCRRWFDHVARLDFDCLHGPDLRGADIKTDPLNLGLDQLSIHHGFKYVAAAQPLQAPLDIPVRRFVEPKNDNSEYGRHRAVPWEFSAR